MRTVPDIHQIDAASKVPAFLFGALIFAIIVFPRDLQYLKLAAIAALVVYDLASASTVRNRLFLIFVAGHVSVGLIWLLIGYGNANPGATEALRLNVVWSVIYYFLLSNRRASDPQVLIPTLLVANIGIPVAGVASIRLSAAGYEPILSGNVGIYADVGFAQLGFANVGFLAFTLVFSIGVLLSYRRFRALALVSVLFAAPYTLFSGRRAVAYIVIAGFCGLALFAAWHRRSRLRAVAALLLAIAVFPIVTSFSATLSLQGIYDRYFKRVFVDADRSTSARAKQARALVAATTRSPFFGTGYGKGVSGIVRDPERPWQYELYYHLLLYNTGVLGLALHLTVLLFPAWIIVSTRKKYDDCGMALLVGYLCYLVVSGTNPYLSSGFDYKLPMFLVAAFSARGVRLSHA